MSWSGWNVLHDTEDGVVVADALGLLFAGLFVAATVGTIYVEEELLRLVVVVGAGSLGFGRDRSEVEELNGDSVRDISLLDFLVGVAREVERRHLEKIRDYITLTLDAREERPIHLRREQPGDLGLGEHAVVVAHGSILDGG